MNSIKRAKTHNFGNKMLIAESSYQNNSREIEKASEMRVGESGRVREHTNHWKGGAYKRE